MKMKLNNLLQAVFNFKRQLNKLKNTGMLDLDWYASDIMELDKNAKIATKMN